MEIRALRCGFPQRTFPGITKRLAVGRNGKALDSTSGRKQFVTVRTVGFHLEDIAVRQVIENRLGVRAPDSAGGNGQIARRAPDDRERVEGRRVSIARGKGLIEKCGS